MAALRGEKEEDENIDEVRKLRAMVRMRRASMGRKRISVKWAERCVPNASAR